MAFTMVRFDTTETAAVSTVLMWILILLLATLLVALVIRLINNFRKDNAIFYEEKGAINLRVGKMPDIRIATKHCKDFKMVVVGKHLYISYANPFGGVKEFKCNIVGEPVKRGFILTFDEKDFKKLCHHLKPGNIAIHKTKITFNYNKSVRARFKYMKKEV